MFSFWKKAVIPKWIVSLNCPQDFVVFRRKVPLYVLATVSALVVGVVHFP